MTAELAIKEPCRVATRANISLSGLQTVDGVSLALNDRVLVRAQTNPVDNGIYIASSGGWPRAADFDGGAEATGGTQVFVTSGSLYADSSWRVSGEAAITFGTSPIAFDPEFLQTGTGAVGRTAQRKLRETVSVKDFGAVGDGVADDWTAFRDAIASIADYGLIRVPKGLYKVTQKIAVGTKRITIAGDGLRASQIVFAPTADGTCIEFGGAVGPSYQQGIRDITVTSNDDDWKKVLLHLRDCSGFALHNVELTGGVRNGLANYLFGGTGGSIALKLNGRDVSTFSNLMISAQRPIVLGPNANHPIAVDHINFNNLYLLGSLNGALPAYAAHTTDYPLVEIEDSPMDPIPVWKLSPTDPLYDPGAYDPEATPVYPYNTAVSNLSFTGRQAWVGGGYGLYWNDTTSVGISNNVLIENVRHEQSHNIAKHVFYITRTGSNLHGLTFRNIWCGRNQSDSVPGLYARRIFGALLLEQFNYVGNDASKKGLDIDSTVTNTRAIGCHFGAGSAVSTTAQKKVYWGPAYPSSNAPADFALQTTTSTNNVVQSEQWQKGLSITLAVDDVYVLGNTTLRGFLMIDTSVGIGAIYHVQGGAGNTKEVSDPDGYFSPSYNTAGQVSIGFDSSEYKIKNRLASPITLSMYMVGPGLSAVTS